MKNYILFIVLFFSITLTAKADEPVRLDASAPSQVILDKPFQVTYTVNASGKDFRLPEITDFDLLAGPFTSQSSSMSIVNGKHSSSSTYKYTYTFIAKNTGKYTIPSASITVKNQKYTSNGLNIEVLPPDAPQQQQNQGGVQNNTQSNDNQTADRTTISNKNLFIRTLVSKANVYEQEAILLTYRLYSTLDVVNITPQKMPDFKGFMTNDLNVQPQMTLENYNGRNYGVADLYQAVIYPQRSGEINIEKTDFDVIIRVQNPSSSRSFFDSFFDTYTNVSRTVTAPGVKIRVNELPQAGKPMAFSGTVGSFNMKSSISTTETTANEAITVKITIEGSGNMRMIKTPELKLPDSFDAYDPKVSNNFAATASGVNGTKTVEYLFIPRHSGEFEIPSVEFSYFDLITKTYKSLRTPSYHLKVLKAEGETTQTTVVENYVSKESVRQIGSDIRYINTSDIKPAFAKVPLVGSLTSWLMFLIPLCITLLIFILLSKQAKENENIRLIKNKKANKIARKRLKYAQKLLSEGKKDQFYDEVLKAIWTYLSDKLSIPVASLTKDYITSELIKYNVDQSLTEQLLQILNTCEFARYAPGSGQQEMGNLFEDTVQVLSDLEEKIKN